jgi:hypothetical protein
MDFFFKTSQLTMDFTVPGAESIALERIRKYFNEAGYQQIPGDDHLFRFGRYHVVSDMGTQTLQANNIGPFRRGRGTYDFDDRFSEASVRLKNNSDSVNIKITIEKSTAPYSYFLIDKYLQNEMVNFKKVIFNDVYEPVKIDVSMGKKNVAFLTLVLFLAINIWLGITLGNIIAHHINNLDSNTAFVIALLTVFALLAVLNQLLFMLRRGLLKSAVNRT